MKMKTSIIAAISLASAGISQAAVPAIWTDFATFAVDLPGRNVFPGGNDQPSPQTIQLNPELAPNSTNTAALPPVANIGAIRIVFNYSVVGSVTATPVAEIDTITLEIQPEVVVSSASFNYSTDGSNGFLGNFASNNVVPAHPLPVIASSAQKDGTETWTITGADLATFFDNGILGETFQVRTRGNIDFQGQSVGGADLDVNITGGPDARITGTVSYMLVPEPSSALLGCTGLVALLLRRRR